ncbi:MAG: hypothetical protein HZB16_23925 [Armatimonadetes bacterium]|nr:hypothetical protein [Armatimonadota bacterium]
MGTSSWWDATSKLRHRDTRLAVLNAFRDVELAGALAAARLGPDDQAQIALVPDMTARVARVVELLRQKGLLDEDGYAMYGELSDLCRRVAEDGVIPTPQDADLFERSAAATVVALNGKRAA